MKKVLYLLLSLITTAYSLLYASLGGFKGNSGALSKIGLDHPALFFIWGLLTFFTLSIGIVMTLIKTKYKYYIFLIILSFIGIMLTVIFDFDYNQKMQYYLHCFGSLTFSISMGINIFLLFLVDKKYKLTVVAGVVLITDLILLLIFKETALIELAPIIIGLVLININHFIMEKKKIEIK